MRSVFELLAVLLAAFGLVSLVWLAVGWLLLPGVCPVRAVIPARAGGDGLEQTVKALLWLRRTGLWRGAIVIDDHGLDGRGAALARALAGQRGVYFTGDDPDRIGPPW